MRVKVLAGIGVVALGAVIYGVTAFWANTEGPGNAAAVTGLTGEARVAALAPVKAGTMKKMVLHREARPAPTEPFTDAAGKKLTLANYAGKVVLVNLWATWCPPCRAEMPGIDRLAGEMSGDDFAVLTISTDRFGPERIQAFYDEMKLKNLAILQDRNSAFARRAGALGLPVTIILDRQGREIARLQGDAEWDSREAKSILKKVIEITANGA